MSTTDTQTVTNTNFDGLARQLIALARRAFAARRNGDLKGLGTMARNFSTQVEEQGLSSVLVKLLRSEHQDMEIRAERQIAAINMVAVLAIQASSLMEGLYPGTGHMLSTAGNTPVDQLTDQDTQSMISGAIGATIRELDPSRAVNVATMSAELEKLSGFILRVDQSIVDLVPAWALETIEHLEKQDLPLEAMLRQARNLDRWFGKNHGRLEAEAARVEATRPKYKSVGVAKMKGLSRLPVTTITPELKPEEINCDLVAADAMRLIAELTPLYLDDEEKRKFGQTADRASKLQDSIVEFLEREDWVGLKKLNDQAQAMIEGYATRNPDPLAHADMPIGPANPQGPVSTQRGVAVAGSGTPANKRGNKK